MRVGDYQLDNTHPIRGDARALSPRLVQVSLPLSDEEKPIRLALWRATDRSYKQASEALTRVRTNVAAKVQDENPAPDFSREDKEEHSGSTASYSLDTPAWEARLRRVSAVFSGDPLVLRSQVSLTVEADNRYYINSEGSQIVTGGVGARIFIQGVTKAEDGMELPLYTSYFATSPDGLPDERQLTAEARAMVDLLARLRKAPLVEPFSGPAILSGRAAGVFFHEIFGHRVEGNRQRNADDGQTFTSRVGHPVLPAFLSVAFDPTVKKVGDIELMGHYLYDDQGVKAQRVTVVDKGVLKTFLLDRAPLKSFPKSNGHGRAEPGFLPVSRQSNLQVESSKAVSRDQLMNQLRDEARRQGKPFGLLFDNIEGGFTTTGRGSPNAFNVLPNVVYRIYTDGREPELVRGVDLIGTPLVGVRQDHRDRRSDRRVQRCLRRRKRRRARVGLVAVAARQRSRSAEEDTVAGNAPDSAGAAGGEKIMRQSAQGFSRCRFAALFVLHPSAQESPTLSAMQDEMKRSMAELRMKGEAAPYYIAYEVLDRTMSDVSGRLGAIVENPPRRTRTLRVEVRVGDYTFDSSRFVVQGFGGGAGLSGETVIAPLDDDYDAMRREIWLTTDAAYKRAITMFARKKAAFQNRTASDPIPDFSQEPPVETMLPAIAVRQPDRAVRILARVQQASAVFAAHPDVDLSEVSISQIHGTRYYLNSEGFKTVAPIQLTSLTMYGEAQAGDGMPVRQTFTEVGRTLADLPPAAELIARARQIATDVDAARVAPIGEEFAGPVLIDGIGGAQFVAETLVQMMQARRPPDAENPRMGQAPSSPFLNRTGLRVMADAFNASDTPSLTQFEGKPLAGSYAVDDEGMRAKDVTLVEKGRLAALLTSRVPQKNFARSNGHGRANTVLAGVFQIESAEAIPATELKEKYIALLKAQDKTFGYIVRGVRSDGQGGSPAQASTRS